MLIHDNQSGIERRSKNFTRAGHALVIPIALFYFIFNFGYLYQREYWQEFFFAGSLSLRDACEATTMATNTIVSPQKFPSFEPVTIPHWPNDHALKNLRPYENKPFLHFWYHCTVDTALINGKAVINYIHLGWIVAKESIVSINHQEVASVHGLFPVSIPIPQSALIQSTLTIDITGYNTTEELIGLATPYPPVIAEGRRNFAILGLELFELMIDAIFRLLPLLTLGLVIVYGWLKGIRIRPILTAIYYFFLASTLQLWRYSRSFLDIDPVVSEFCVSQLRIAVTAALFYFFMETVKIKPRLIYPLMRLTILWVLVACPLLTLIVIDQPLLSLIRSIDFWELIVTSGISVLFSYAVFKKIIKSRKSQNTQNILYLSLVVTISLAVVDLLDIGFRYYAGKFTMLNDLFSIAVPLLISIIFLDSVTATEKMLLSEKRQNEDLRRETEIEKARSDIVSRFLPNYVLKRFDNSQTMQENLNHMLKPQPKRVAVLQADMRNFSHLASKLSPAELTRLLQRYYQDVVDAAQVIGVVKLIGDAIFLFVEDDNDASPDSATDKTLRIALQLVQDIQRINAQLKYDVEFGIAIHHGLCVVGNLSSENCIDYTAIGLSVNLTARLEEFTKNQAVKSIVGKNGILLTKDAITSLRAFKNLPIDRLLLSDVNAKIRSFEDIQELYYLSESAVNRLTETAIASPINAA